MIKNVKNVLLILLFLTLSVSVVFLAYLHFFEPEDRGLSGEWIAELDVTKQAAAAALDWLQDIEAVSVSMEDVEACMEKLTIRVNMTLERTDDSGGTFRCNVLPESYEACRQDAYKAFAEVFQALLAERLHMAGYAGSTDREAVEALVTETFGMSTVSYLMSYGPSLLPSLEELQSRYDGSGTYETAEGVLIRRFDADSDAPPKEERYIREGSILILTGESVSGASEAFFDHYPVMYTLKQNLKLTPEPIIISFPED